MCPTMPIELTQTVVQMVIYGFTIFGMFLGMLVGWRL